MSDSDHGALDLIGETVSADEDSPWLMPRGSGAGKTQFLLSLLLAAQLSPPHGVDRPTIYISTEHALPTQRLNQLLANSPLLASGITGPGPHGRPSLARVFTLHTPDLETQDHILAYQLPVVCKAHKPGLIVLDSIAANYRDAPSGPSGLAARAASLQRTGALLRKIAREFDCAIIVSNHVADRFTSQADQDDRRGFYSDVTPSSSLTRSSPPPSAPIATETLEGSGPQPLSSPVPISSQATRLESHQSLTLDHQQRFFTGWDTEISAANNASPKTPALGLVWAVQIAARIAIVKEAAWDQSSESTLTVDSGDWAPRRWRRWIRLVFAAWSASTPASHPGIEIQIWAGGVRAVANTTEQRLD